MQAMPSQNAADPPLKGLRVVEFGQFVAVPAAGQTLADLGADVIKIEPPAGDAARFSAWQADDCGPMFSSCNRGKRSVVLNLRDARAREQAFELAAGADVVLQNARPRVMDKMGLGADALMTRSPRLIYGSVSGFGENDPQQGRPGFDIAAQAESGMMSLNGNPQDEPMRVGFTVVDVMAAHALATGVLAALVRRGLSGRGGRIDVSLIDVAVEALNYPLAEYALTGQMPVRTGNGQPMFAPAADVFATADGLQLVLSAYVQEHFVRLCACIDRPDLVGNPRFVDNSARVRNRAALRAELGAIIAARNSAQLSAQLTEAGVVNGVVRTLADLLRTPEVTSSLFVDVAAPGREPIRLPGLPLVLDRQRRCGGRLPGLGEHTQEVLAGLTLEPSRTG
ncbi:MAG TPA: CoA transferase [Ramlibacter sp.]|nr:CoA transferase [Ramlibacter sp.]